MTTKGEIVFSIFLQHWLIPTNKEIKKKYWRDISLKLRGSIFNRSTVSSFKNGKGDMRKNGIRLGLHRLYGGICPHCQVGLVRYTFVRRHLMTICLWDACQRTTLQCHNFW